MSDIPVGSPPAPPGRHAAPGGWYPDPLDQLRERYWDGWQWSRNTRELEGPPPAPRPAPWSPQAPTGPAGPTNGAPYGGPVGSRGGYVAAAPGRRQERFTADGVPLAAWGWRALAGLLDSVVTGIVCAVLTVPFYRDLYAAIGDYWNASLRAAQAGAAAPPNPSFVGVVSGTDQLLAVLMIVLVGLVYQLPFLRTRAATPGMLACGLRVVPLDEGRSRTPLAWSVIGVRTSLWVLPWAFSLWVVTLADVLVPIWHPRRQTLHDLAARTQVVRIR